MDFFNQSRQRVQLISCGLELEESGAKYVLLNWSLPLNQKNLAQAPENVRVAYADMAQLPLGIYDVRISKDVPSINLTIFAYEGAKKDTELVSMTKALVQGLRVQRPKNSVLVEEIALRFASAALYSKGLWHWAADYIGCDCFIEFEAAQLQCRFDDKPDKPRTVTGRVANAFQKAMQEVADASGSKISMKLEGGEEVVIADGSREESNGKITAGDGKNGDGGANRGSGLSHAPGAAGEPSGEPAGDAAGGAGDVLSQRDAGSTHQSAAQPELDSPATRKSGARRELKTSKSKPKIRKPRPVLAAAREAAPF